MAEYRWTGRQSDGNLQAIKFSIVFNTYTYIHWRLNGCVWVCALDWVQHCKRDLKCTTTEPIFLMRTFFLSKLFSNYFLLGDKLKSGLNKPPSSRMSRWWWRKRDFAHCHRDTLCKRWLCIRTYYSLPKRLHKTLSFNGWTRSYNSKWIENPMT